MFAFLAFHYLSAETDKEILLKEDWKKNWRSTKTHSFFFWQRNPLKRGLKVIGSTSSLLSWRLYWQRNPLKRGLKASYHNLTILSQETDKEILLKEDWKYLVPYSFTIPLPRLSDKEILLKEDWKIYRYLVLFCLHSHWQRNPLKRGLKDM